VKVLHRPPHNGVAYGVLARATSALVTLAVASAVLGAQSPSLLPTPRFRSEVDLITVSATVIDQNGHPVTGLPVEAFELFEDGDRQTITQFTNERVPISVAVLLDVSDSMFGQRLLDARAAVEHFLFDLLDKDDEFSVVSFNHEAHPLTGWTQTPDVVRKAFEPVRPWGATAIYDALLTSLPVMVARSRQRAGMIIISDGGDTASDASVRDVKMALLRSDAFVYAIALDPPARRAINHAANPAALSEITDGSGGHTEVVHATADLESATATIADELNKQYLLAYSSSRALDGTYHSIRVRTRDRALRVRARNGYIASVRNKPQ
jgi:Ca-activated chloride channel family protein